MSNIDNRVVDMQFNNGQFENGVKTSIRSLDSLKKGLNLDESSKSLQNLGNIGKSFSLAHIADGVQNISSKFSALGVIGFTVLQNITNSVIKLGEQLVRSLAIDPLKKGLEEYETQIGAIQTIMANTASKGTTLQQVNAALDELNTYSDKTIYNFTQMAKNIGTFTAAGVDLNTSVSAIKGIANLAAVSGSTADQASTAMYQLSQALASGTVKLMDWNSVVNAGMGGEVFKNALMDTARVHGIAIDDMVKKEGSFRETLQSGWLTSQILTETLSKFTGDLSAAQLKSMGYTEKQTEEILKLGVMANDAATKVKTFSQLMSTINEAIQSGWAQSWRIIVGDFEEAKSFWTDASNLIGGIVSKSSEARNSLLQGWKDLGGRTALLYAIRNAFDSVVNVVQTFSKAFSEIFPPITAKKLFDITNGIRLFSITLLNATKNNEKLKTVFKGIAAVFDIVFRAISALIGGFGRLIGAIMPSGTSILDFLVKIAKYIIGIDDAVKATDYFNNVINNIAAFLSRAKTAIVDFYNKTVALFSKIKEWFKTLFSNIDASGFKVFFSSFSKVFDKIKERFGGIFQKPDLKGIEGFGDVLKNKLGPALSSMGTGISKVFGKIGQAISDNIAKINWKNVFDVANFALITSLILSIKKFIDSGSGIFKDVKEVFGGVTGILDGVKDSLKAWQSSIKAKTLLTIAISLAILTASLVALSMIDSEKLTAATIAITAMFADLVASMAIFEKVGIGGSAKLAVSLLGISAALLILSSAITVLSKLDKKDLAQGLLAIAGILAELALFLRLTGGSSNVIATAIGLNILGLALLVIAAAMKKFGDMPAETIQNGLLRMGEALAILFAAVKLMPKDMPIIGIGLMLISVAIGILAKAISAMGNIDWDVMERGLVGLGASLGLIAIGINAMRGAIGGAAALLIATAALALLLPVLKGLGMLSLTEIGTALLTIAGVFTILGLAGLILGPVVPVLLGLGAAMLLLGVGGAAVGLGLLAFSAGLAALAVTGAAGAAALVLIVTTIIGTIPLIAAAIAAGIIAFAQKIAEGAPMLVAAIGTTIMALVNEIVTLVPQIVAAAITLVTALLTELAANLPKLIQAGMDLLIALLQGIADNIGRVVETAITIVTNFLDAIAAKLPDIIQSGVNLILSFIEGVTKAIRENEDRMIEAAWELGDAIIKGVLKGINMGVARVRDLILTLATQAIEAMKKALGISSPSKEFTILGRRVSEGFANGISDYGNLAEDAVTKLGNKVVVSMTTVAARISDAISSSMNMNPTIRPVVDLTSIISGGKQIDKILGVPRINMSKVVSNLPKVSNEPPNSSPSFGQRNRFTEPASVSFTQNNYSPEPLSRIDIYRQTKNQLIALKGLVSSP